MPTNQNHLAVLIREISQQRIAIPSLAATEPLELLLEIGLEKVAKDYEYIFSESKICGGNELNINDKSVTTAADQAPVFNGFLFLFLQRRNYEKRQRCQYECS